MGHCRNSYGSRQMLAGVMLVMARPPRFHRTIAIIALILLLCVVQGTTARRYPDQEHVKKNTRPTARQGRSKKYCDEGQDPKGIGFHELKSKLIAGNALLIDLRNQYQLEATCKIPWSFNVPLNEFKDAMAMDTISFYEKYDFSKPSPSDRNVVFTLQYGFNPKVWKKLKALGFCNAKVYFGSWIDWKNRGAPLMPIIRNGKMIPEKC